MADMMADIAQFIFLEDEPQQADIIFVTGGAYACEGHRAAQLYKAGYAPYILPSGRYSVHDGRFVAVADEPERYPGPYATEWEFLADVCAKDGVPREAILQEDRAVSTWDNARFSKRVTDAAGLTVQRAILCCKSLHARRAYMYYQFFYPETKFFVCPCDIENITRANWNATPEGTALVMSEMEKCGKQFGEMFVQRMQGIIYDPDEPSMKDRWAGVK